MIEKIDAMAFFFTRLRIFPRFFLLGYSVILHMMVFWIMGLTDITTAQAIITSVVVTLATPLTKFYIDSGTNMYDRYEQMVYSNKATRLIDFGGYVLDKTRIVSLSFILHFALTFVMLLFWSFGLGDALTHAQATFISVYAANASVLLGFFITSDKHNRELEEQYKKRVIEAPCETLDNKKRN